MITVYGADWCEDTRRSLRHLRRLGVSHRYLNVDEDLDALRSASTLNEGERRTPIVDLGVGGPPLVEPANDILTEALVELEMLTQDDAYERLGVQNVGDLERVVRMGAGAALVLAGSVGPRTARWPLRVTGAALALSGMVGWCPGYHSAGVTSIDGPGDRPDEAHRQTWLGTGRAAADPDSARRSGGAADPDLSRRSGGAAKAEAF
jgi:glutaredoxin